MKSAQIFEKGFMLHTIAIAPFFGRNKGATP